VSALTGLTLVKEFTYRGNPEQWSNKYHFRDNPPGDAASWHVLAIDLINEEKKLYGPGTKVVQAYGYNDDAADAIAVWDYNFAAKGEEIPGTYAPTATEHATAGDQAACLEWMTTRKNSRGKWVYLRKYMHGAYASSTTPDSIGQDYGVAAQAFCDRLNPQIGAFFGGIRARTHDDTVQAAWCVLDITTGKRPKAQP